jgi:hypothetical protein
VGKTSAWRVKVDGRVVQVEIDEQLADLSPQPPGTGHQLVVATVH